jgi:acyl-CoA synthetase (AMP-forming)/AMP-acid ligase II
MADRVDRSSVRIVIGGAGMESTRTLDELDERLPDARFVGVYGSTESGNFVTVSSADDERAATRHHRPAPPRFRRHHPR